MKPFDINAVIRKNIRELQPYSSARSEYVGNTSVMLDANENSMGSSLSLPYNRYPDPLQKALKARIGQLKNIDPDHIFIGNGSDEPIDLLIRATCDPGTNNIIIFPPTYGMYEVAANISDVAIKSVLLTADFQLDVPATLQAIDENTRLLFICSPNNPTGNLMNEAGIITLLQSFAGIVVLDEAYIDFAPNRSLRSRLSSFPNLVILQTFSKAWGLAGLRLGVAYASREIIDVLNKIKAPYNINLATQQLALQALSSEPSVNDWIAQLIAQRQIVKAQLEQLPFITAVYPSDANFLLVKVADADHVYSYLTGCGIVVRNRTTMPLVTNCIRITIGTADENNILVEALKKYTA